MHGEFKTPGGKLIAVDFNVHNDLLQDVVVTGDFFLYPEEALPMLAGAIEGAPATLDADGYAEIIRPVLTPEIQLLGSSAEALAMAVVRALHVEHDRLGDGRH